MKGEHRAASNSTRLDERVVIEGKMRKGVRRNMKWKLEGTKSVALMLKKAVNPKTCFCDNE